MCAFTRFLFRRESYSGMSWAFTKLKLSRRMPAFIVLMCHGTNRHYHQGTQLVLINHIYKSQWWNILPCPAASKAIFVIEGKVRIVYSPLQTFILSGLISIIDGQFHHQWKDSLKYLTILMCWCTNSTWLMLSYLILEIAGIFHIQI